MIHRIRKKRSCPYCYPILPKNLQEYGNQRKKQLGMQGRISAESGETQCIQISALNFSQGKPQRANHIITMVAIEPPKVVGK